MVHAIMEAGCRVLVACVSEKLAILQSAGLMQIFSFEWLLLASTNVLDASLLAAFLIPPLSTLNRHPVIDLFCARHSCKSSWFQLIFG